jgi:hypothetical protein
MSDAVDRERSGSIAVSLAQRLGAILGEAVAIESEADGGSQCAWEDRRLKLHAQNSGRPRRSTAS